MGLFDAQNTIKQTTDLSGLYSVYNESPEVEESKTISELVTDKKEGYDLFKELLEKTIENRSTSTTTIETTSTTTTITNTKIENSVKNVPQINGKGSFEKVVNFWLKKGFKMAGAVALATICKFESGFNPKGIEKSEKAGKGYGVSKNNTKTQKGYGAGLYAWTGGEHKEKALRAGGYDPSKVLIENLNFDQQLELAYNEFSKLKPDTFNLIKNTNNIKEALNIAYAYLSAGSKNSKTAPSDAECEKLAHKYQLTHAKLGYKKAAKTNTYEQRLKWAIEQYNKLV